MTAPHISTREKTGYGSLRNSCLYAQAYLADFLVSHVLLQLVSEYVRVHGFILFVYEFFSIKKFIIEIIKI